MHPLTMLNNLENLLEDRTTGDDISDKYEVVVAGVQVMRGILYIAVKANDGKTRHFRLTEV